MKSQAVPSAGAAADLLQLQRRLSRRVRTIQVIFFLSGFAALLYQVSWQRLLTVYYGVGSVSTALIVSIYMFGLGTGAYWGGQLAESTSRRLRAYVLVELAIGVFGLASPLYLDRLGQVTAGSSYGWSFLFIFVFLAVPTFLMGATLPLLIKIYNGLAPDFFRTVSVLYFINTLGAAFGALIGAYVVITFFGLDVAVYLAAAINFALAAVLATFREIAPQTERPLPVAMESGAERRLPYAVLLPAVFVTGFCAIAYEIVWFRMIGVLVKDSPYSFSSVLFMYLLGIGIGSFVIGALLRRSAVVSRVQLFFTLQFLIAGFVAFSVIAYYYLTLWTPFSKLSIASFRTNIHPTVQFGTAAEIFTTVDIFVWPLLFVLIPTMLMGASFPLASSLGLHDPTREGRVVGEVYFTGVAGNVCGGLITSFVLLPWLKTEGVLILLILIGLTFGLLAASRTAGSRKPRLVTAVVASMAFAALALPRSGELYRLMHFQPPDLAGFFLEEGREGVVLTTENGPRVVTYINGSPHGGRPGYTFYYETIETMSYASHVTDVLVIGFGTGSSVETVLRSPEVRNVTLVELNATLLKSERNVEVLRTILEDARVELIVDDGRRFLWQTDRKFDLILIDPLRSRTAYSNNIYSTEFFELGRSRLKDGGAFLIWTDEHYSLPRTVQLTFPNVRYYDFFLIGSSAPLVENRQRREALLGSFDSNVRVEIERFNNTYRGDETYIETRYARAPLNRDWKPVTEYYLRDRVLSSRLLSPFFPKE